VRKDGVDLPSVVKGEMEEPDGHMRLVEHGESKVADGSPVGLTNAVLFLVTRCCCGDTDIVIKSKANELGTGKLRTKIAMYACNVRQVEVWADGCTMRYRPCSYGVEDNAGIFPLYADGYKEARACVSDGHVAWELGVRCNEFLGGVVGDVDEEQFTRLDVAAERG
jgi:hypothetical protein